MKRIEQVCIEVFHENSHLEDATHTELIVHVYKQACIDCAAAIRELGTKEGLKIIDTGGDYEQ